MSTAERPDVPPIVYSDVEYVFEPNERALPPIREYFEELWERRRFLVALAKSELRGARSSTWLGELWGVLDPVFMAAIYYFLITLLRGAGATQAENEQRLAIMVGCIFLFSFTQSAITDGGRSILKHQGLMLNSTFPRALLPLTSVYRAMLQLVPALAIYAVFHAVLHQPVGIGVFMLPFLFVVQVVMATGLAFVFATLTIFLRDTTNLLGYLMRILFFATPILYPVSFLSSSLQTIMLVNPFYGLFASYQAVITGGTPDLFLVLHATAFATLFIVIGYRVFVSNERTFALRL